MSATGILWIRAWWIFEMKRLCEQEISSLRSFEVLYLSKFLQNAFELRLTADGKSLSYFEAVLIERNYIKMSLFSKIQK